MKDEIKGPSFCPVKFGYSTIRHSASDSHAMLVAEIVRLREQRKRLALHCETFANCAINSAKNDRASGLITEKRAQMITELSRTVLAFVATCKD